MDSNEQVHAISFRLGMAMGQVLEEYLNLPGYSFTFKGPSPVDNSSFSFDEFPSASGIK